MIFKSKINTICIKIHKKITYTTTFLVSILLLEGMVTKCTPQAHNINESDSQLSINYIKNTKTHISIL